MKSDIIVSSTGNKNIAETLERFSPHFNAVQSSIAAILLDQNRELAGCVPPTLNVLLKQA